ncbi:MAG: hypothetical protein ABSC02_13150 [Acidobacteriota bacterium]|jgi:hypothetical protein
MNRNLKWRITLLSFMAALFLLIYGIGRYYSPGIVGYVVEEALVQKAPEGMSPTAVRKRFEAVMAVTRTEDKMLKLLTLSNYLEKVQKLTPAELHELLPGD